MLRKTVEVTEALAGPHFGGGQLAVGFSPQDDLIAESIPETQEIPVRIPSDASVMVSLPMKRSRYAQSWITA